MRSLTTAILVSGLSAHGAYAQPPSAEQANTANNPSCVNDLSWTAPQTPFRIYGNTWYVGPRGLGVFLVTARTGDVLIDGGVPEDAPLIEANIRSLGIDLHEVKWILNSHAHCDHAGGIAQLAHDTGAQVIAGAADNALLARGGHDDAQYADRFLFPPVRVTRRATAGERLHLGNLVLIAHATPGHTKGNTTWTMKAKEGGRTYDVVFAGSATVLPGVVLTDSPKYPEIAEDYARAFRVLRSLPCDVFLGPHASFYDGLDKADRLRKGAKENPFIDPRGYREYVARMEKTYRDQLQRERDSRARRPPKLPRAPI